MNERERKRARFARRKVREAEDTGDRRGDYRTQLVGLPARLHVNGLGQAMAFYRTHDDPKSPQRKICVWMAERLAPLLSPGPAAGESAGEPTGAAPPDGSTTAPRDDLIDLILASDAAAYRRASAEARALALWLKRFAEAFLPKGKES